MFENLPWGLILSGTILLVICWVNFVSPYCRRSRLQKPTIATFVDTENGRHIKKKELFVRANSRVKIELEHEPKLKFEVSEISFGFIGEIDKKPEPMETFNSFVMEGANKSGNPSTDQDHYIDRKRNYHIRRAQLFTPGNTYVLGFDVKTNSPGRYPVRWHYFTEEGEGRVGVDLILVVE